MPAVTAYLKGFGIHQGMELAGYTLEHIQAKHITVERFREYSYPIFLIFTKNENSSQNSDDLLRKLKRLTRDTRIIKSRYGNPYKCDFGTPVVTHETPYNRVVISTTGHSHRV